MFGKRSAEAQLRTWMERPGNWRLKGLLAAAIPDSPYTAREMGRGFENLAGRDGVKKHHLSKRDLQHQRPASEKIRPLSERYESEGYKEVGAARTLAKNDAKLKERELEQGVDLDKYMGRMLLNDSTSEKDVLWREQLLDSVIQGAEEAKVARDAATVIEVDTKKGDHPVRGDDIFAEEIAEGAGIPFNEQNFSTNSWDADKYGLGAYITEEMIDHALIDIIEMNVRHLGRATENALNRVFMNELVDNVDSNNDHEVNPANTPAELDFIDLFAARNNVIAGNWPAPDTIVMHDEAELGIFADSNNNALFANRLGDDSARRNAAIPEVANLSNAFVVPDGPYDGSNTWGYGANGEVGAVMYPQELMFVYLYRDLETKDFEDPIRDLEGANVRGQFDAVWGQSSAGARLTH